MDPLQQFIVKPLWKFEIFGYLLCLSNSSMFMILSALSGILLWSWAIFYLKKNKNNTFIIRALYKKIYGLIRIMLVPLDNEVNKNHMAFLLTIFTFIFLGNIWGMIPLAFTFTGQIINTFVLALIVLIAVMGIAIVNHGFGSKKLFVPSGVPLALQFFLVPLEILSFCIRSISLSVRLFANMMAGHAMLKIFSYFSESMGIWGIFPVAINIVITGLEFGVAFLQAYIFTLLSATYLKDARDLNH